MLLVYLAVCMQKNENKDICINAHTAQVQVDKGPQYKKKRYN